MCLSGGFVDVGPGLRNPVMLQVSPVAAYGVAVNRADVVVSSNSATGKALQDGAESSRSNIEATGLKPDTVRIRDPEAILVQVDVGDEMFATPSGRIQAVGEAA